MAFSATTFWEVQTGGSDSLGGGFDPSNANMATDLAATSATGTAPVVTSASYNFAARDVGAWVFIKSGTNWTAGWYQIASVASNAATLTAAIGTGVLSSTLSPTTVAGVATTGSPTSGTWSVDYSQGTSAGISYTDLLIAVTTTNYTSAANPVGPNIVGNVVNITSGVNFTVQRVQVVSVSSTTATCDKSLGTAAAASGVGALGGCLKTPGQAGALMVGGNAMLVKSGTHSITSASINVVNGCPSLPAGAAATMTRMIGYGLVRGDSGTKPLLQAGNAISAFSMVTLAAKCHVENVSLDGANLTTAKGFSGVASSRVYRCKAINCTNSAFANHYAFLCEGTSNSTATVFLNCHAAYCVAHDNTFSGFSNGSGVDLFGCAATNNAGATSDGFLINGSNGMTASCCLAYGNGRDGFRDTAGASDENHLLDCLAVNNSGYGFNATAVDDGCWLVNCGGYNNTSGLVNTTNILAINTIGLITLTADPFVNAAGNNFSINYAQGGGALLRAAGIPTASGNLALPGLSTPSYSDVGASQSQTLHHVINHTINQFNSMEEHC